MNLKALIFDVDGTLADSERDGHRPAFNAAFAELGLSWHWDEELYGRLLAIAGGKERLRFFAERHDPAFLARPDADELIGALHRAKTRLYLQRLDAGGIWLRPGVARLIGEARGAGLRLAIATTTARANVTALLRRHLGPDAASWFAVIGAGDAVAEKKPSPAIYRWVLERLDVPAAACLAIEDSAIGLQASLAAGLPTLIVENDYTRGQDFTGALAVLPDLATLTLDRLVALRDP